MEAEYIYTCPGCSHQLAVPVSLIGQNLACPNCKVEFFATPPDPMPTPAPQGPKSGFTMPAKLPFFKSARQKLLEQKLQDLLSINNSTITNEAKHDLRQTAIALGLPKNAAIELLREHLIQELAPIKERMQSFSSMTDHDWEDIHDLKKKYNYDWDDIEDQTERCNGDLAMALTEDEPLSMLDLDATTFRATNRLEATGSLPRPLKADLMLNSGEVAYWKTSSVWSETRVHSHGYVGASVSLPTGIKHVRLRFGGYTPIKSEELTELSRGKLYVTSERLLFNGDKRNTTIPLKKIVDGHIFSDALKVEKSTGQPDYFTMRATEAHFLLYLIGVLKQ